MIRDKTENGNKTRFINENSSWCPQDGARKTALLEDNNNLISYYYSEAKTFYEVFQRGLKVSGDGDFLYLLLDGLCMQPASQKQFMKIYYMQIISLT